MISTIFGLICRVVTPVITKGHHCLQSPRQLLGTLWHGMTGKRYPWEVYHPTGTVTCAKLTIIIIIMIIIGITIIHLSIHHSPLTHDTMTSNILPPFIMPVLLMNHHKHRETGHPGAPGRVLNVLQHFRRLPQGPGFVVVAHLLGPSSGPHSNS